MRTSPAPAGLNLLWVLFCCSCAAGVGGRCSSLRRTSHSAHSGGVGVQTQHPVGSLFGFHWLKTRKKELQGRGKKKVMITSHNAQNYSISVLKMMFRREA